VSCLRFHVGDLALVVLWRNPTYEGQTEVVEIVAVGPFAPWDPCPDGKSNGAGDWRDYLVQTQRGRGMCDDWQLRPINPPKEPASLTRTTDHEEPATA
jgi:hypothetical protein